ncbi:MAG: exo-beta-N-acetylmuramidase NamZ domain-containing protein [Thermodesulfobacteriota bacterium]
MQQTPSCLAPLFFRKYFTLLKPITTAIILAFLAGCAPALLPPAPPPVVVEPPPPPPPEPTVGLPKVHDPRFTRLDTVAAQELAAGHVPGAVIFVGHQGQIVYHRALGQRTVEPYLQAMTEDTVFDLASLTKVVATTTAIMKLHDAGRLRLDDTVAKYWPEFAANGKGRITVRQLLTHTSGLRAEVNSRVRWSGYEGAMAAIAADKTVTPPGTAFRYSDANFIALGEIVHRVSGLPLDVYCAREIFRPLGLKDTAFRPKGSLKGRIAPTDLRWGKVHDPTAWRMGGVAGNAGVFSTADDLAVFVQMLLDNGVSRGRQILSPGAVAAMIKPCTIPGNATRRGLGWDICSPYSRVFNGAFPMGSFGHTGYTGTSLWIDPKSKTFLIILTNRLHPHGKGQVKALRARISAAVAQAIPLGKPATAALGGVEPVMAGRGASDTPDKVKSGLEVLAASGFAPLKGKNIGVITNHTGIDAQRRSTLKLLLQAPGVKVKAIFSPEHGLSGKLDEKVASGRDAATGLHVYSLYGKTMRPTAAMLQGLDALVYDIQDVGARFYTYITTMAYAMEAAAARGLEFYVLDRPDPINAAQVQGPVLDPDLCSFIGYCSMPVRYGMTAGEMAQLFNRERHIGARLQVVKMEGYRREAWFDQTGLPWVNPSPNLRSLTQAILYPGVGLVESANISVGRGTAAPFEVIGAPWIAGSKLAGYLRQRHLAGIEFEPVTFVPASNRFRGQRCGGVRFHVTDRAALDSPALGIELLAALHRFYPREFQIDRTLGMIGSREVLRAIKNGDDPRNIKQRWQASLESFRRVRAKYLLY